MGGNYNLEYKYYFSEGTTLETDFMSYLNANEMNIAPPDDLLRYDENATIAKQFSAVDTISWLENNINNYFSEINNSYCFYLIDLYTNNYVPDYHYYSFDFLDPDTGTPSLNNYTNLYGGEYPNRGVFLDLSAGPIYYWGHSPEKIPPMWNYTFPLNKTDFNYNLKEYIRKITDFIFLPCYIYQPITPDEFNRISIVILDDSITHEISNNPNKHINVNLIKNKFEEIIPESTWEINIIPEYWEDHPSLYSIDDHIKSMEDAYNYLSTYFNIREKSIIVLITIESSYKGTGGVALPDQVVSIYGGYGRSIEGDYAYYSRLIIHEVGHEIGLFHPHDYVTLKKNDDSQRYSESEWIFDFISTPMTYAHYDISFSTFDRESIARAHTLRYINKTCELLYQANKTLLDYSSTIVNSPLESTLKYVYSNKTLCYSFYEARDFFEAHHYAKQCFLSAQSYYDEIVRITGINSKIQGIGIIMVSIGITTIAAISIYNPLKMMVRKLKIKINKFKTKIKRPKIDIKKFKIKIKEHKMKKKIKKQEEMARIEEFRKWLRDTD